MTDGAQQKTARRTIWLAGASGTIGRALANTLLSDGHRLVCMLRESESGRECAERLTNAGAQVVFDSWPDETPDTVISCIASRSGAPKDAEAVDFQANLALLKDAESAGGDHFILLSAICVQKPRLAFQHAKIAFERALKASSIDHTIIRPTAYFKSLSGQVQRVANGGKFFLFGDGRLTRCKPISDRDLARFIADSVIDPARRNQVLPIGGPGPAISLKEQGEMLFDLLGEGPRFRSISPRVFTAAARVLSLGAPLSGWLAEKAEYARIAHYYATESMLVFDPATGRYDADATPEFGSDTLRGHYAKMVAELRNK